MKLNQRNSKESPFSDSYKTLTSAKQIMNGIIETVHLVSQKIFGLFMQDWAKSQEFGKMLNAKTALHILPLQILNTKFNCYAMKINTALVNLLTLAMTFNTESPLLLC